MCSGLVVGSRLYVDEYVVAYFFLKSLVASDLLWKLVPDDLALSARARSAADVVAAGFDDHDPDLDDHDGVDEDEELLAERVGVDGAVGLGADGVGAGALALQAFDGEELHVDAFGDDVVDDEDFELHEEDLLPPLDDDLLLLPPPLDDAAWALPTNASNNRHSPVVFNVFIFQPSQGCHWR